MADIRIKDLATTASAPAADDYAELDGPTNGGRKLSLFSWVTGLFTARTISTAGLATGGGTLAADRTITVTAATLAQIKTGSSSSIVVTPQDMWRALISNQRTVDLGWDTSANTGTATSAVQANSDAQAGIDNSTGATAGSTFERSVYFWGLNGQNNGTFDYSRPVIFSHEVNRITSSANSVYRLLISGQGAASALNLAGFGIELRNQTWWIVAHNGTSLTQYSTGVNVSSSTDTLTIESNGAGTISLYREGTLLGSTSGGPTSVSSAIMSSGGTNGADSSAMRIIYFRAIRIKT